MISGINRAVRHFCLCQSREMAIFMALSLFWPATAPAEIQSDDEGEPAVILEMPLEEAVTKVRRWVFHLPLRILEDESQFDPQNADEVERGMDQFVSKKIAVIDQVCGLTVGQKEKLRLAGHGDHKRLIDRLEKMGKQLQLTVNDDDRQIELEKSARLSGNELVWLCSVNSLFAKTVDRVLTSDQASKYRPLRDALSAGCHVGLNRLGPADGLEIIVARTSFADENLRRLGELPGIRMLTLSHLRVTDAGMAHIPSLVARNTCNSMTSASQTLGSHV
jgi:hypothetical protein